MKSKMKIFFSLFLAVIIITFFSCKNPPFPDDTEIIPVSPANLTVITGSSTQIDLTWTDNSDNEDGFKIEQSTDGSTFTQIDTVSTDILSYSGTGLDASTLYYYQVRAYNTAGNSGYSNIESSTTDTASVTIPVAPGTLAATTFSSTQIDLTWADNSDDEDGFKIERSLDNITFTQIDTVSTDVASSSDIGLGLDAGTLYYYQVRAYNTAGDSSYSNTASATTFSGSSSQIIADHTVVDKFDQIPPVYLAIVKTMLVDIAGESHSLGYRIGMDLLETFDSNYVSTTFDGTRPAVTTTALRIGRHGSVGEEDFYTNTAAIANIKAHIQSQHDTGNPYHVLGFGWCWDMTWINSPGGTRDPVYQVRWAGSSSGGPDGNLIWGLDTGDQTLTGNSVSMNTYLNAVEEYITYCETSSLDCQIIFTTGPVDGNSNNENGFQREVKHDYIRNYVQADSSRRLFDYADILCFSNSGSENFATWDDSGTPRIYSQIHPDNMMDYDGDFDHTTSHSEDGDHIGEVGAMRLAKAMWWMLARIAGWDGN